jgi:hypothetical protein
VTRDGMPMSACSTCHNNNNGVRSTPVPVSTTTATPNPTASPLRVTVTVNQNANQSPWGNNPGGDRGLWLQDTIEQRQTWTKRMVGDGVATGPGDFPVTGKVGDVLQTAAGNMGYANAQEAYDAFMAIASNKWTTAQRAFLSSFTNAEFVTSEGSFGLHNWDYSREIVNTAMMQAKIAQTGVAIKTPWVVTLKMSKNSVNAGATIKFTGTVKTSKGVAGAGKVKILKRINGTWKKWLTGQLNSSGGYSISQKVTNKGTFYVRTVMPANSTNTAGQSKSLKLVVK